jgi:hypothetical protein
VAVVVVALVALGLSACVADPPPTIGTATAGDEQAVVSWQPPLAAPAPITAYVVTPWIGFTRQTSVVFNSPATTQTVVGLTNGVAYGFTVKAINALGNDSASSGMSNRVTPAPPTDWAMYRSNPAHTGAASGETVIGTGNVGALSETWTTPDDVLSGTVGIPPIVAGGRAYVQTVNGFLFAYDAHGIENCSGSPKRCEPVWKAQVPGAWSAVRGDGGVVYNAGNGLLSAYDAGGTTGCSGSPPTCQPLWTGSLGAGTDFVAPPTISGGIVYVTGVTPSANVLFAFDAAGQQGCTGAPLVCAPLWTAPFGPRTPVPGDRSPTVANGRVFVTADYTVHAFDAGGQEGCAGIPTVCSELWTADVPPFYCGSSGCQISTPAVANGVLYVTGEARDGTGGLYAFDAGGVSSCGGSPKQCSPLWTANAAATTSPPAVANGVVYTDGYVASPADGYRVRAFDGSGVQGCTGAPKICAPIWTSTTVSDQAGGGGGGSPTVANGVIYVAGLTDINCDIVCEGIRHLLAFDGSGVQGCTGTPTMCSPLLDVAGQPDVTTFTDPIVSNGVLYVGDGLIDSATGPSVMFMRAFEP